MNRLSLAICAALLSVAPSAAAQRPAASPRSAPGSAKGADGAEAKAEAERVRKGRQEQARALLFALSGDARGFRDQQLRARSLTRIADALWDVAAEQARAIFREAWEAAQTADRESAGRLNLRGEVLRLTAERDRLLAEEFLQKLKPGQQDAGAEASAGGGAAAGSNLWELPEAAEKRLSLAEHLLRAGDTERALQFADPVLLAGVTISTMDFLTLLRGKNPAAADERYAALLAGAGGGAAADANTISLLSSYIFTPNTYVIFNSGGGADSVSMASTSPPANVGPQLHLAFFQTASAALLRPQSQPEQGRSADGVVARYMVLKRLLPLFEQHAPKEIAAAARGQFEALDSQVSEAVRQSQDEGLRMGITPTKQLLGDQEHSLLERAERAQASGERDDLYFRLASLAVNKEDPQARDYAGKIDDAEFRRRAQSWVDANLAIRAVRKKKVDAALGLAREGELTHIQRAWVLCQAAKLLAGADRERALLLLDEATAEARRIDGADPDRPRALLAAANALSLLELARAWDAAAEAVKAANAVEGFTGEGGALLLRANGKSLILRSDEPVSDFDVAGVFGELAGDDYDRAVQLARGFQGEAPRVNATIAIARSVLGGKAGPAATTRAGARN